MAENKQNEYPNVPPLRFPEFSEPWERKKLSCFLYENKERNKTDFFSKEDVLSVSGDLGIVNQIELLGRSFAGKSVKDYHVVRNGNIVYTKSPLKEYPYGIIKYNRGIDGIVSTLYAVYHVLDNADGRFIEFYFSDKGRINRYLKPIVRIGAKHDMKIGNEEVLDNYVVMPSLVEQDKIATFIELLNKRIAVQSKLIEDLKQLKSALVERLYSQHNPNCRIGDLFVQVSKRNHGNNDYSVLSVNNRLGFIEQSEQFEERSVASDDTSNYKVVSRDDFAYNPARINVGSIARLTSFENGIVSPMYICFHTKKQLLPQYLEHFFDTRYFHYEMQKRLEGSVRLCLSWEGLCNIPIAVPPIEQQEKVGKRISRLADKISLEERHIDLLKSQKQYLLQAMFI